MRTSKSFLTSWEVLKDLSTNIPMNEDFERFLGCTKLLQGVWKQSFLSVWWDSVA
jgi:hypothetical protein